MKRPDLALCSRCGRCLAVCPSYLETGLETNSPRGRIFLIQEGFEHHPAVISCLRCGSCEAVCPNRVPLPEYLALSTKPEWPIPELVSEKLWPYLLGRGTEFFSRKISGPRTGHPTIFLSCGAEVVYPGATERLWTYLKSLGFEPGFTEPLCCGLPLASLGQRSAFLKKARETLTRLSALKGPILTLCASCLWTIKRLYPLVFKGTELEVKSQELASTIEETANFLVKLGKLKFSQVEGLYFHLPCHLRETPPGWSLPTLSVCCGSVGGKALLSKSIPRALARELVLKNPKILATACTGCYLKLRRVLKSPPEVKHWVEYLSV